MLDDNKIPMSAWEPHYFGRFALPLPEKSEVVADYEQIGEKIELVSKNASVDLKKLRILRKVLPVAPPADMKKQFSWIMEA